MSETKIKKRTVGQAAQEAIRAGKTNEAVLAAVKSEFPAAKTSLAAVNWYRNDLRAKGEQVPSARDLRRAANAEKANNKGADPLE